MLAKKRFFLADKASQIDDRSIILRWSETGFLNTLPSFLQRDKDILGLAEAALFEEERRRMLETSLPWRVNCVKRHASEQVKSLNLISHQNTSSLTSSRSSGARMTNSATSVETTLTVKKILLST